MQEKKTHKLRFICCTTQVPKLRHKNQSESDFDGKKVTVLNMKFEKIYYIAFFSGLVESCLWNSILDSNSHVEMKAKVQNDEMDIDYLHDTELTPVEILEALLRKPRSLDYFEDDKIIFDFCDSNNDGALTWSEMVNCFK